MKENGRMVSQMEREFKYSQVLENMRVNSLMV